MTTLHHFDLWGWYTPAEIPGRATDVAPDSLPAECVVGQSWPNFTGEAWVLLPYSEPPAPQAPPPAPRLITVGAFFDRFGPLKWAILADTNPQVQAVVKDASVRSYIDLDNADLPAGLALLQSAGHAIDAEAIIDAPVGAGERP